MVITVANSQSVASILTTLEEHSFEEFDLHVFDSPAEPPESHTYTGEIAETKPSPLESREI